MAIASQLSAGRERRGAGLGPSFILAGFQVFRRAIAFGGAVGHASLG